MKFKYQFDKKSKESPFLARQIKRAISDDPKDQEFILFNCQENIDVIRRALGDRAPRRVIDLGCGIGRMSLALKHLGYPDDDIFFYLADSTAAKGDNPSVDWHPNANTESKTFYNDLELTAKAAEDAGLDFQVIDIRKNELEDVKDVDLVMSFLAVGWHFPIDPYHKVLKGKVSEDCIWVFGAKPGKQIRPYESMFKSVEHVKMKNLDGRRKEQLIVCRDPIYVG